MWMADKSKYYFTQVHEDAIVEYANTLDVKRRTELYIQFIDPVFNELINNIVYTFKFQELPNIEQLKNECKIWVTTIFDKFDPEKGSAAFAFFTVVIKNWFIAKVKTRKKKLQIETSYEDIQEVLEKQMIVKNEYESTREEKEFVEHLRKEIESWDKGHRRNVLGHNDIKVIHALQDLFEHSESIEIFNKKAIYLNIRELTNLNTKQITRSIKKLAPRYLKFKKRWIAGEEFE
jgi:hypothetical protein